MADIVLDLIKNIGRDNIADDFEEDTLNTLALRVIETYQRDLESMAEWSDDIEEGQRIAKQDTSTKNEPWRGAANFKSTIIETASISFGDRGRNELLRGKDLLKLEIIGNDAEGQKKISSENVGQFMNWQINHQMRDWRDKQESLLYQVPSFGAVFKKPFYDSVSGTNKSDLIQYPDFAVNQACPSMEECKAFSILLDISRNEVADRQAQGIWLDVDIYPEVEEDPDGSEGSNENEDTIHTIDNPQKFIEQHCFYDLNEDGREEPYIVTVHEQTSKVVRIVTRYQRTGIFVQQNGATISLQEMKNQAEANQLPVDLTGTKLARIVPDQTIVDYSFIKAIDGTFLGRGYYHMLTSLSKAVNSATNILLDSGVLATLQGGFLARGFRQKMGEITLKPGEWIKTDIPARDLSSGMLPHLFKEPSEVLFALLGQLTTEAKEFSVNLDLQGVLSPNAPATTTLALLQEAMTPMSAIMGRIIRSESKEFEVLFKLNGIFADPALYQKILDDPDAKYERDFDLETMNISPTADAEMSSRMQRIQRGEVLISQSEAIQLQGGDTRPIWEAWFDAIGATDMIDKVWPSPEQMTAEQQARADEREEAQRREDQKVAIDIDHKERGIAALEKDTASKVEERKAKSTLTIAEMKKKESEIILNLEKAETEQSKNQIDKYTADLNMVRAGIEFAQAEIELDNNEREIEDARKLSQENTGAQQSTSNTG